MAAEVLDAVFTALSPHLRSRTDRLSLASLLSAEYAGRMLTPPLNAEELKHSFPQLRLLILHGSRARADAREGSDWDFAYLADSGLDELGLRAALARTLQTDAVDVVDLERAGAVLRYQTARDGKVIVERNFGDSDGFRLAAIRFWLEIEPVLAESHRAVLERLG